MFCIRNTWLIYLFVAYAIGIIISYDIIAQSLNQYRLIAGTFPEFFTDHNDFEDSYIIPITA